MLDFFVILSRSGIVLWYMKTTSECVGNSINTFLRSLILKENLSSGAIVHENLAMKYYMDNEFDLIFIAGYQNILQLSYVDKFLTTIALKFRDKYKNDLLQKNLFGYFENFKPQFESTLCEIETESRKSAKSTKLMRTFEESVKSKKTIASMIINKEKENGIPVIEKKKIVEEPLRAQPIFDENLVPLQARKTVKMNSPKARMGKVGKKQKDTNGVSESPAAAKPGKKVKMNRRWTDEAVGEEAAALDYSSGNGAAVISAASDSVKNGALSSEELKISANEAENLIKLRGTLQEGFDELEVSSDEEVEEGEGNPTDSENDDFDSQYSNGIASKSAKSSGFLSGLLQNLKSTATGRVLSREDIQKPLEQLRDHLVQKNVAYEIATRLCEGVAERLVGVQLGPFERVGPRVRSALEEACTRLLASGRRVDVLRDALDSHQKGKPYVIIAFWLIEKNLKVLIAACDTFRSGAVEQLRTHVQKLNFIHPPSQHGGQTMVELYEKGYGKDAANIAMSAISYAKDQHRDVVLVDTAGRMQDNEPLMRALAKLIIVNDPDLVLFVGEALVGNEAIDQLVKFNQSLADYSNTAKPHTIDGILLTKFDTIDDKVGAAVSMAHISGQPIVFVGTGQTYSDLRQFSVPSVVKALMK
ncbi:unnamed protein product [Hymenolepis diminuta]|uniref:SRP54 domain-containing protein n=1 Tax=Hymenolepis diminuta TaxID=6216 RepID=A0A158QC53_HYMDI|nr:unnamed protein product [Hymenolepis diminuta]